MLQGKRILRTSRALHPLIWKQEPIPVERHNYRLIKGQIEASRQEDFNNIQGPISSEPGKTISQNATKPPKKELNDTQC